MDDNETINQEAAGLAIKAYQYAKQQGCEEALAMNLASNAHQHWLFALAQKAKLEMASLLATQGKLS